MALADELRYDAAGVAVVGPDEWLALSMGARVELDLLVRGEGYVPIDVLEATFLGGRMLTVTTIVRGPTAAVPAPGGAGR